MILSPLSVRLVMKYLTVCEFCDVGMYFHLSLCISCDDIRVPDPRKGVCADPVNGGTILGKGGPDPQGGNKERQLSPDKGKDKT
jgi:hypothetical protein